MNRAVVTARVLVLALVVVVVTGLPAVAANRRSSVSAQAPHSAKAGVAARVTGVVTPRGKRAVLLQARHGHRWSKVRRTVSSARGTYALSVPTARAGRTVYRVFVPAVRAHRSSASRTFPVSVTRTTAPRGRATSYSYLMDTKFRWNPCAPIGYRVNPRYAPASWRSDVAGTLRRVTARSGLRFADRGTTSILPGAGNDAYPAGTQLVIAFAHVGQSSYTAPQAAGIGGAFGTTVTTAHGDVNTLTEGFVVLNADVNNKLASGFGLGNRYGYQGTRGQLLMHEVGHAVGLGHADHDSFQIMFPSMSRKPAAWGRGDINGLASVGSRGGCIEPLASLRRAPAPVRVGVLR